MIELHRDHKSHMPEANRQRAGLIRIAAINRLHFEDGSSADLEVAGSELMQSGLKVNLPAPLSSELVFLTEIATNNK